jgi:hypothetical protein
MGVGNYVHVISDIGNFRWRARAPGNGPIIGGRLVSAVLVTLRWWEVVRGGIGRGAPGYRGAWYAGIDDGWWRGGAVRRRAALVMGYRRRSYGHGGKRRGGGKRLTLGGGHVRYKKKDAYSLVGANQSC